MAELELSTLKRANKMYKDSPSTTKGTADGITQFMYACQQNDARHVKHLLHRKVLHSSLWSLGHTHERHRNTMNIQNNTSILSERMVCHAWASSMGGMSHLLYINIIKLFKNTNTQVAKRSALQTGNLGYSCSILVGHNFLRRNSKSWINFNLK